MVVQEAPDPQELMDSREPQDPKEPQERAEVMENLVDQVKLVPQDVLDMLVREVDRENVVILAQLVDLDNQVAPDHPDLMDQGDHPE